MGINLTLYRVPPDTITRLRDNDAVVIDWLDGPAWEADHLDVDKAWDVLGRAAASGDPSGLLLHAAGPLHKEDLGYGPALHFTQDGVAALARAVCTVDRATLLSALEDPEPPYPYFSRLAASEAALEVKRYLDVLERLRTLLDRAVVAGDVLVAVMG